MDKNEVDLIVLGALLGGPSHGYEVKKRIALAFASQYPNLSDSAVYPRLARFEKEGLVTSKIKVQKGAPNKKIYQLTETWVKKIKELAATPVRLSQGGIRAAEADMLSIHIVFFQFITKDERRKIIEPFYLFSQKRYADAMGYMENYPRNKLDKFVFPYLEYGIRVLKLSLELYEKLMEIE